MQLRDVQTQFKNSLLKTVGELKIIEPVFSGLFEENDIPLQERLNVYHNNVIGGTAKALAGNFPLLEKLVGEDFLISLCRTFVIQNPPRAACMQMYGDTFADIIAQQPHVQKLPYLPEIARLEIAINKAYYAPDDQPLKPDELTQIPEHQLADTVLSLQTSCSLLSSPYPLLALRAFCLNPDTDPPDLSQTSETHILIFRPHLEVQLISMNKSEYIFLENIFHQNPLGIALTQALAIEDSFDINTVLQKHLLLGTFKSL